MTRALHARLSPLILLFACLQALLPGLAAAADAWRVDQRAPYAHIESDTHTGCVFVHTHDCMLCGVATSTNGEARPASPLPPGLARQRAPEDSSAVAVSRPATRTASQRAPPVEQG